MNKRRDLLLQQMGITQWQLVRPERLKGSVQLELAPSIQLVMLSDQAIDKRAVLFQDIFRAINIDPAHCLTLPFAQLPHLVSSRPLIYWLLSDDTKLSEQTQALCPAPRAIWQSPSWQSLSHRPLAKRQLWQAMYQSLQD